MATKDDLIDCIERLAVEIEGDYQRGYKDGLEAGLIEAKTLARKMADEQYERSNADMVLNWLCVSICERLAALRR